MLSPTWARRNMGLHPCKSAQRHLVVGRRIVVGRRVDGADVRSVARRSRPRARLAVPAKDPVLRISGLSHSSLGGESWPPSSSTVVNGEIRETAPHYR